VKKHNYYGYETQILRVNYRQLETQIINMNQLIDETHINLMKYYVHRYEIVRMKIGPIEAKSMEEAINKSDELADTHNYFRNNSPANKHVIHIEAADECDCFLVDTVNDDEYKNSKWFNKYGELID